MMRVVTVPIHLDALYLEHDLHVLAPTVEFLRLPHRTAHGDVNSDIPWLSEQIVPQPFAEDTLTLRAGIHLHWALPDHYHRGGSQGVHFSLPPPDAETAAALDGGQLPRGLVERFATEGVVLPHDATVIADVPGSRWYIADELHDRGFRLRLHPGDPLRPRSWLRVHGVGISFPPVPNRWLVRRRWQGKMRAWIVESDYIHPPQAQFDAGPTQAPICYPDPAAGLRDGPPYCRVGRVVPLESWFEQKSTAPERYLRRLTAVGFGDPNFAVFYPNCHSVFGLHDAEGIAATAGTASPIDYQLVGWHADPEQDPLHGVRFVDAIDRLRSRYGLGVEDESATVRDGLFAKALEAALGWRIDGANVKDAHALERTVLLASVKLECGTKAFADSCRRNERTTPCIVAVGHTGTEALSAYAGHGLDGDKSDIEDQLESLHLAPKLEGLHIDIGPKFREARHEKEFASVDAGSLWVVVADDGQPLPRDARLTSNLRRLNAAQSELDQHGDKVVSLRRQVYADWCKYMMSAYPPLGAVDDYPDMDEVRRFIESTSLPTLDRALEARREARKARDAERKALQALLVELGATGTPLTLKRRPAPRFWRPNEPVVLIAGESLAPTPRHGEDGILPCGSSEQALFLPDGGIDRKAAWQLAEVAGQTAPGDPGHRHCCEQPWHPVFLDWRVEVMPVSGGDNIASERRRYDPGFIEDNFRLDPCGADVEPLSDRHDAVTPAWNRYEGRSILTPHAGLQLRHAMEGWLRRELGLDPLATDFLNAGQAAAAARGDEAGGVIASLLSCYAELFGEQDGPSVPFLSQSLTGFNAALLMQRQTMQLPIADPLGFADDRDFADRVDRAVGTENRTAPQPRNDFNPIRAGRLRILALRLVDTFGQIRDVDFDPAALITAEAMATADEPHTALLRPRLSQPARLDFRWLAARSNVSHPNESTDHPDETAVCGWLLHDLTDRSLLVLAADGAPLGRISADRQWSGAPGAARIAPWQIPDPGMARLVAHLLADEGLPAFIGSLERHLERIVPEEFAQHDGIQWLLGRPLAVVRARLALQLQGLAAINEDWNVFRNELAVGAESGRTRDGFDEVRFPVRLGDPGQLNDGLVAFWEEMTHHDGRFVCTGGSQTCDTRSEISLSIAGGPAIVTMLIDPRARVHARTGILPTKAITLPKAQYADVLARMSVAVPVGPVLTPAGNPSVPAPDVVACAISWLQQERGEWLEEPLAATQGTVAEWSGPVGIREGWLKLTPKGAA